MPDKCPKCGGALEPGDVKCPACNAELPPPSEPAPPQKAAVLAAAMLPVVFVVVVVGVIGGIGFAGMKIYRILNKPSANPLPVAVAPQAEDAPTPPAPVQMIPPPVPAAPVVVPAAPAMPVTPPTPPVTVVAPPADVPLPPPPLLTDFVPPIVKQGSQLVLRGQGFAAVDHVTFISTHGAKSAEGTVLIKQDAQLIVTVPKVSFENDPMCIMISSPGGVVAVVDQHMRATPVGPDEQLRNTAIIVRENVELDTGDNMVLIARNGSAFSIGDNSIAFVERNVTVKARGKNCRIYYVGPIELAPGVSRDGMIDVGTLQVSEDQDAFRVKPAPPDVDQ